METLDRAVATAIISLLDFYNGLRKSNENEPGDSFGSQTFEIGLAGLPSLIRMRRVQFFRPRGARQDSPRQVVAGNDG